MVREYTITYSFGAVLKTGAQALVLAVAVALSALVGYAIPIAAIWLLTYLCVDTLREDVFFGGFVAVTLGASVVWFAACLIALWQLRNRYGTYSRTTVIGIAVLAGAIVFVVQSWVMILMVYSTAFPR